MHKQAAASGKGQCRHQADHAAPHHDGMESGRLRKRLLHLPLAGLQALLDAAAYPVRQQPGVKRCFQFGRHAFEGFRSDKRAQAKERGMRLGLHVQSVVYQWVAAMLTDWYCLRIHCLPQACIAKLVLTSQIRYTARFIFAV